MRTEPFALSIERFAAMEANAALLIDDATGGTLDRSLLVLTRDLASVARRAAIRRDRELVAHMDEEYDGLRRAMANLQGTSLAEYVRELQQRVIAAGETLGGEAGPSVDAPIDD